MRLASQSLAMGTPAAVHLKGIHGNHLPAAMVIAFHVALGNGKKNTDFLAPDLAIRDALRPRTPGIEALSIKFPGDRVTRLVHNMWRNTMKLRIGNNVSKVFGLLLASMAMVACAKQEAPVPAASAPEAVAQAAAGQQEPAHAVVVVPPDKSAPVDLARKLAEWKSAGILSNAVLVKRFGYEEKPGYGEGFNDFAILDFPSDAAYDEWRASGAGELGPDVIVSRVDALLDRKSKKNDPSSSIFVVSQYESLVSPQEYQDYTDAYIEPNMANQYYSGIMTRYTMYLEREATGGRAHPTAILVTEYANQAEYDRKSAVKDAYKAVLLSGTHPEWARINDTKKAIRTDLNEVYANPVELK